MAVNEPIRIAGPFVGDGSLVELDFDFETFAVSDVTVVVTDADGVDELLTINGDYTVTLNSGSAGGSVTLLSPLATGTTAHVYGDAMPYVRTGDIITNPGGFFPAIVNAALDRIHVALLQLSYLTGRAVKAPRGEQGGVLPPLGDRANKFAAWDSVGDFVGVEGALAVPALASNIAKDGGGSVQDYIDNNDVGDKVDKDGTDNVRLVTDASNPEAYNIFLTSVADGKQVDGIYGYHEIAGTVGSAGYAFHGVTASLAGVGEFAGGGIGGACGGAGGGSGVVGNRGDDGLGHGGIFTRLGTGPGNGVYGIAQGTGEGSAGRFLKQNPVAGTAGTGPALFAINDSTNGQALYARSASANTDSNTAVVERLNGTGGTGLFTQITGAGPRVSSLIGGSTQVIPGALSTGASLVYGYDIQVGASVSGATDTRGLNVAVAAIGAGESIGASILVDGARTTSYGLFVNVANAGTNYGVYVANGLSYFGDDANAATQYQVAGTKVLGAQGAAVADAVNAVGVPTQAEFNALVTQLNALLARCRAHGLIAT